MAHSQSTGSRQQQECKVQEMRKAHGRQHEKKPRRRLTLLLLLLGGVAAAAGQAGAPWRGRRACCKTVHRALAHFLRLDCGRTDGRTDKMTKGVCNGGGVHPLSSLTLDVCSKTSALLGLVPAVAAERGLKTICQSSVFGQPRGSHFSKLLGVRILT